MKNRSKPVEKAPEEKGSSGPRPRVESARVEMKSQVLREIRRHARSSMSAEICGVLIGAAEGGKTIVEAAIPGEDARQGGSHVTFTQDTWSHIYRVKDAEFPDQRIVGWYHSHPGFGVFLSEHDIFIHRNFFSDPSQIAWVYDPHSDEEGCFAWEGGEIKRITEMSLRDDACEPVEKEEPQFHQSQGEESEPSNSPPIEKHAGSARRVAKWIGLTISHLLVLLLGAAAGAIFAPPVVVVTDRNEPRPAMSSPANPPDRSVSPEEGRKK
jgi:proteasome lid subunit RPN8/RPN11